MATGKTVLKGALRLLNVKASVDSLSAAETEDGKEVLNDLLDSLSNEKLMLPALVEVTHTMTANDGQYSIGSGGDINVTRPLQIESALVRKDNLDYPVQLIESRVWNTIYNKETTSNYPRSLYYRASFPLGEINLYPKPSETNTLILQVWEQLTQITDMNATLTFPPGYNKFLKYQLAMDLAPEYGKQVTQDIRYEAKETKKWVETANYGQVSRQTLEVAFITGRLRRGNIQTGGFI